MKKILGILSIMFLLVSCECESVNFSEGNGVSHDEKIEIVKNNREYNFEIYKMQYNNHDYIVIEKGFGKYATMAVEHDPDCKTCKK
jgi:hypothetical protein